MAEIQHKYSLLPRCAFPEAMQRTLGEEIDRKEETMQSKGQFEQKVWEMIEPMPKELLTRCLELYDSGGVSPEDFEDNFELPRIALKIALEREAEGITPMSWLKGHSRLAKTYRNLKHF